MSDRNPASLFTALAAEFNRYLLEKRFQIERNVLTFPAAEGNRFGQALFSGLSKGGFCTFVVTGRRIWDPCDHYYQAARFSAQRGCEIHRAFLLPHRQCRHDPTLREHIQLDDAAGIHTTTLYVGELITNLAVPFAESLEFGIWDDVVGCIGVSGPGGLTDGVAEWRVTSRSEDLQTLQDIKRLLQEQAPSIGSDSSDGAPDLEEPMITTAPMAHELATVLCQGDHVSPEDCSWYHSVWQYLRIFKMVSTPTWHTGFFIDAIREIAKDSIEPRVFISGTADYSMLAHVLRACNQENVKPKVTILDLCETPLFLCKWYGRTVGTLVQTIAADVLEYESPEPFQVIVSDAFLTRFSPDERTMVVAKWHELLVPGGSVVTTVRIEPGLTRPRIHATPEQADAFRRRALQEARRWQGFLHCQPEEVANLAQRYAKCMTSYALTSKDDVETLLSAGGFRVGRCDVVEVPGEMASTLYVEVIACRC